MIRNGQTISGSRSRVLIMGLTFKENCPDLRNTKVVSLIKELGEFGCQVDVTDSWASSAEAEREYGLSLVEQPQPGTYNALVIAVAHKQYTSLAEADFRALLQPGGVLFDLKGVLALGCSDLRL